MITFLLIILILQLCAIGFMIERSLYTPYLKNLEDKRIIELQKKLEKERKESREKAKQFNNQ